MTIMELCFGQENSFEPKDTKSELFWNKKMKVPSNFTRTASGIAASAYDT